jgi:hypothetical protein
LRSGEPFQASKNLLPSNWQEVSIDASISSCFSILPLTSLTGLI